MASPTVWEKTKSGSKKGFDKLYSVVDKLGAPVNRFSNRLGAEAFWPTELGKESDKAARILRSFCKDGFYHEEERSTAGGPKQKQKVLKKIPTEVIRNAKGLAIFTTMRTGLWVSGAGGSGVLIARKPDGSWSGPSGIMLHTAGLGFLVGVDIYDCVVVINTQEALNAFSTIRCTLGGEISAVAGPVGVGGILESEVHKRQAPVFTYLKSRGFYAGVQIDGTIIIERTDENESFYGERIGVRDVLKGNTRYMPPSTRTLIETIRSAQGDRDINESLLPTEAAPADFEVEKAESTFGVPDADDPDPYGVLALENAGMEIREAGTKSRPPSEQFAYKPSPTSPTFSVFHRRSMRSFSSAEGFFRRTSVDQSTQTEDRGVQTDPVSDTTSVSPIRKPVIERVTSDTQLADIQETTVTIEESKSSEPEELLSPHATIDPQADMDSNYSVDTSEHGYVSGESPYGDDDNVEIHDGEGDDHHAEEAQAISYGVVHSPLQSNFKVKMVAIPKRIPPKLPARNPRRPRSDVEADKVPSVNGSTQTAQTPDITKAADQDNEWKDVSLDGDDDFVSSVSLKSENPWRAKQAYEEPIRSTEPNPSPWIVENNPFTKQDEAFYSMPPSPSLKNLSIADRKPQHSANMI